MTAIEVIEQKLRDGMVEGNMHACLRDTGRLAGGYAATGALSAIDLFHLEGVAVSLSLNGAEGRAKWSEAVVYGRGQPVEWVTPEEFAAQNDRELDWDAEIGGRDKLKVVDHHWLQDAEVEEPGDDWDAPAQLATYLSALFQSDEHVAYSTESWKKPDTEKYLPTKGVWDRTASQLIDALHTCKGDIGAVVGDYKPEVGAWIRFNPFDGKGIRDENVTEYRYALVESDSQDIPRQIAILKELELPIAAMVHSGKKSVHAIVRIEADTFDEYRERVDFLYEVCKKNGLEIDRQNRNPSRLSRMPGIVRNGRKQFLLGTNMGKASWKEWDDWIQDINDDLPDIEPLANVFNDLPPKSPELIAGVLREGHKMRIAGPSKAGKSFALIQLATAIAEGRQWMGWDCAQGRVLYVNLELDRPSCLHRFADVYKANGWSPDNVHNIDIWNLRGRSKPLDQLAPKLIRRAHQKQYKAVIIDPIYKVLTGDENSADEMANFCNQFDKICVELNAAVIDCHHHSKGAQGDKKSSDRASGSGVFARDPDALIDLIELNIKDARDVLENQVVCDAMAAKMNELAGENWRDTISMDDALVEKKFLDAARGMLTKDQQRALTNRMADVRVPLKHVTGWRVEGTLREFAAFKPRNLWFRYPIHIVEPGMLDEAEPAGDDAPWKRKQKRREKGKQNRAVERKEAFFNAMEAIKIDGEPTFTNMMEYLGIGKRTLTTRLKEYGYKSESGLIVKKLEGETDEDK